MIFLVTMATLISLHVKDKNAVVTSSTHDEDMIFFGK